jgi:superfamily II DNA or RNA helicase
MDIKRKISSSKNWQDLKAKIDASKTTKEKGDLFELITKLYLQINPKYCSKFKSVWLYNEVPTNTLEKLNLPTKDMGIDLIAESYQGEFWAVQCKYKSDESKSLTWKEISTFESLAFVKGKGISAGLIATTVDRSSSLFKDQNKNVSLLSGDVWRNLDEEFFKDAQVFLRTGKLPLPKPFKPHPHQKRAIKNAHKHYILERESRGKMIMPCGTGKSLTAYWIAKELKAKTIVVAVPSLSLINQTLNAWLREVVANKQEVDWIAVCSDKSAGEVDSAITTQDLGIPTNTDPEIIAKWLRKRSPGLKVVFTTYQSGRVLAEASRSSGRVFDLGIMDEAHKTVGDRDKTFAHLLSDENIRIRKRVFMTATERRYAGNRDEILSMDDHAIYGATFELLSFKEALEQDPPILSDYKILTMAIHRENIAQYVEQRSIIKPDRGRWNDGVQAEMLAGVVALQQAMEKYPIRHAVSFHTSIAKAKAFQENQQIYSDEVNAEPQSLETFFVSGKTPTSVRSKKIQEFSDSKKALITNARCLTEGVDVPKIDGVLFADPKRSTIDIVQAVGRALRTAEGKEFGYIIIPVLIEDEANFAQSGAFQTILTVLRALASNDERIVEYFREKSSSNRSHNIIEHIGSDQLLERVNLEEFVESIELQIWNKLAKLSWRPFNEAREYVRSLELTSQTEWKLYCKSGEKSDDIPANPNRTYSEVGWVNWGDWLGSGTVANRYRKFKRFRDARNFAHQLALKSQNEWFAYSKSGNKPDDIPGIPSRIYKDKGWISWGDWLGTWSISPRGDYYGRYRSYTEARKFARSLQLGSSTEWKKYCYTGQKPDDIPAAPDGTYKNEGWTNWGDWLGTGNIKPGLRKFKQFYKAKSFVRSQGLKSITEWEQYCKSGQIPDDIPKSPSKTYDGKGWTNWGDWLGTGNISVRLKQFRPFHDARIFAQSLGLRGYRDWRRYCESGERSNDIPASPDQIYADSGWLGWSDFLGSHGWGNYRSFSDAKAFARSLKLKSLREWKVYSPSGQRPEDIPSHPETIYKDDGWLGWPDFLGYEPKSKGSGK